MINFYQRRNNGEDTMEDTMSIYETSTSIITELAKHGVTGYWMGTGGGCTAVYIDVKHDDPEVEDGLISITNGNSQVDLSDIDRIHFTGWVAIYAPTAEDALEGINEEYVHGNIDHIEPVNLPTVDLATDTVALAAAVAAFVKKLAA